MRKHGAMIKLWAEHPELRVYRLRLDGIWRVDPNPTWNPGEQYRYMIPSNLEGLQFAAGQVYERDNYRVEIYAINQEKALIELKKGCGLIVIGFWELKKLAKLKKPAPDPSADLRKLCGYAYEYTEGVLVMRKKASHKGARCKWVCFKEDGGE